VRYAYYPGCSLEASGKEYDMSTRAVFKTLDVELEEITGWNCCGATAAYSISNLLAVALPARNLALAEGMGLDIITPCSECYHRLRKAEYAIKNKPGMKEKVERAFEGTGLEFSGRITTRHPLDVIINEVGIDRVKARIKKGLKGLKVAPYYGCVIAKPPEVVAFESVENPTSMDMLIEAAGGVALPMAGFKTRCCGGPVLITREELALGLTSSILKEALEEGADCMVTPCPLCGVMLDAKQRAAGIDEGIPVLYFTQLLGLALGIKPKKLGLDKNFISTERVLEVVSR
jgi:heterodisulfide reductase subunit B